MSKIHRTHNIPLLRGARNVPYDKTENNTIQPQTKTVGKKPSEQFYQG